MTERTSQSPELDEETPTFRLKLVLIVFILLAIYMKIICLFKVLLEVPRKNRVCKKILCHGLVLRQ